MHKIDYFIKSDDPVRFSHEAMTKKPFGPEFTQEQVDQAKKMDIWGSEFHDSYEHCDFVLIDKNGLPFATSTVKGY